MRLLISLAGLIAVEIGPMTASTNTPPAVVSLAAPYVHLIPEGPMKHNIALPIVSLLSLLFMTFHMTHDVIRQAEGAVAYPIPVLVFALWLYGTLVLSDRVWGHII